MARTSRVRTMTDDSQPQPQAKGIPVHLEDWWDEPDETVQQARKDLEALQGAWTFISGRRPAQFLVSGTRFAIHFADGEIYFGSFTLTPYARPKAMDVRIEEGPGRHKGQTVLCIYELSNNTLRWCIAGPGQSDRPPAFPAEEDTRYLYLIFRRENANGLT
jgi:uncharacterized protein (TIGR03067 family)